MLQEHKDILKNSIKDFSSVEEKFSDFEINSNFQLLLSQLDLFKLIASLVVGIIGIGYLYDSHLDGSFLLLSLIFALATLFVAVSYTREVIDLQPEQNKNTHAMIVRETTRHINTVLEAFKKDDPEIFFDYARAGSQRKEPEQSLNWIGEIIVLFFYLSIGFLGMSFVSYKFPIKIISYPTVGLLIIIYLISFKSWAVWLSEGLSTPWNKVFRKNSPDTLANEAIGGKSEF